MVGKGQGHRPRARGSDAPPQPPILPNPNSASSSSSHQQDNGKKPNDSGKKQRQGIRTPNRPPQKKTVKGGERKETLDKIEAAVASAWCELIAAGEHVSAWKVSQSALVDLQANSWDSLGFQLQDVPSLHQLMLTEGKINAFIHCHVAAQKITSLFDLEEAICKNEAIEEFEELQLGPFVRQPLVMHYFSLSKDVEKVYKITSEEIVSYLFLFLYKKRKNVKIEEFLDFVAKKRKVTSWEKLGVRIQSLGMHIGFILKARNTEYAVLKKCMETVKGRSDKRKEKKPLFSLPKHQLDGHFSAITERITSLTSVNKEFCGQHLQFVSSSSDEDDVTDSYDGEEKGDGGFVSNQCESLLKGKIADTASCCPYPSVAEELTRLGLRGETGECSSLSNQSLKCNQTSEPPKKKKTKLKPRRRRKAIGQSTLFRSKGTKKEEENNPNDVDANDSIRMLITTWNEACREHSAAEVSAGSTDESPKPSLTEEEKKMELQELSLREGPSKKKEEEERMMEREREKWRIRIGKELLEAERIEEENERKRLIALKKAEKEEERRALEKICQKLEEDKAERRQKLGSPPEDPLAAKPSPVVQEKKSALPVKPVTKAEQMRDCIRSLKKNHKDEDVRVKRTFQTLFTYAGNVVKNPDEEKFRKIRLSNQAFQDRVGGLTEGIEFLELCGFEKTEDGEFLFMPREKVDIAVLNSAGKELHSAIENPHFGVL